MPRKPTPTKPSPKKRVGIWIRVSTDDQARGDSPEHHEQRAIAYAEVNDWRIVETYHLEGVSGKSVREHPETQRMMEDVAAGRITGLIFSKLARLARNTKDLLEFSDYFDEHEADLISLDEKIDTSSPAGRLFYTLIAAMATWEREEIASRVAASVPIRAKLGKNTGGVGPFGYHWVDKKLIPNPKEVPILKLIFELFVKHQRFKTVARTLNERGHRTRKGRPFSDSTVTRLLQDSTSKGLHRANYADSRGPGEAWDWKPEEEWIYQPVEAVVSEKLWDQANAIIAEMRKKHRPRRRKTVHLFSGLTFCHCGATMYPAWKSPNYTCQKCRNKIPGDVLESLFQKHLTECILSPEELAEGFRKVDETLTSKESEVEALKKEQKSVQIEIDKAFKLYSDGRIDGEGFQRRNDPLEVRMKKLEESVPNLQGKLDALRIEQTARDETVQEALTLQNRWPKLSKDQKRFVIESITENITVGDEEVEVTLRYLPFDPEKNGGRRQHNFMAVPSHTAL